MERRSVRIKPGSLDGLSRWDRAVVIAVLGGDIIWSNVDTLPGGWERVKTLVVAEPNPYGLGWLRLWFRHDGIFATLTPWAAEHLGIQVFESSHIVYRTVIEEIEELRAGEIITRMARVRHAELEENPKWTCEDMTGRRLSPRSLSRNEFAALPIAEPEPPPLPAPIVTPEPETPWSDILLLGHPIGRLMRRARKPKKSRRCRTG